ncbi:symporter, partial [Bacillus vallismortis]|nr:symporter [Bacillus vallismortis]
KSNGGVAKCFSNETNAHDSMIQCYIMPIGATNLIHKNHYRDLIQPNVSKSKLTLFTRKLVFVVIGLEIQFGILFHTALETL